MHFIIFGIRFQTLDNYPSNKHVLHDIYKTGVHFTFEHCKFTIKTSKDLPGGLNQIRMFPKPRKKNGKKANENCWKKLMSLGRVIEAYRGITLFLVR
jgi:hypothetical protein